MYDKLNKRVGVTYIRNELCRETGWRGANEESLLSDMSMAIFLVAQKTPNFQNHV